MNNKEVAALFLEMSELLDIHGGDRYRAQAFRRAARIIGDLSEPVSQALQFGKLQHRRGIGEGIITRTLEILRTGQCRDLNRLRAGIPTGVRELLRIEGLGPRTVRMLYTHLRIASVDDLEQAARAGMIARLPRMGERAEERLLAAIADYRDHAGPLPLPRALEVGAAIAGELSRLPEVQQIQLTGSARRRKELVGDLDLLVACSEPLRVNDAFGELPLVREIVLRGEGRTSARLVTGQRADLRFVVAECFGAGLHYFTGSKQHNIAIRVRGNKRGLKISEYGVFLRRNLHRLSGGAEQDVFAAVGLPYIPPELREDDGEIQAAAAGRLPALIEPRDLQGDLHVHTTASVGSTTARRMAEAAAARGLRYLAITDHSRSLAHGIDERKLLQQARALRRLAAELAGPRLLAGVEVEILPDGRLDLDPAVLAQLDWVVAAAHSRLDQSREEMTARLVRAMESGVVDCIGHPLNRLLGEREPVELDLVRVLVVARNMGVALELNAGRLDLDAGSCRQAKELRVPVVISSAARTCAELERTSLGVYTARRGWLEPGDVLNAGPLDAILDRRRHRQQRASVQVPSDLAPLPAPRVALASARLVRALQRRPLSRALERRLDAWLRGEEDSELNAALERLSDNPLQTVFDLLCGTRADRGGEGGRS
jgi:DNA polymerase (family 10)